MKNNLLYIIKYGIIVLLFSFSVKDIYAQYFGKNKVQYEKFDFKIIETPHFQIYYYLKDSQNVHDFARDAEKWYHRHQKIFNDTIKIKSPIILYNNHADFQQTTVIGGTISTGTGGVTEGLRNRVIMPYSVSQKETSHVLGHEMVHVFQYRLVKQDDSLMINNIMNVPLWMIEGMAEYLSVGKVDAHTAMWMRDAVQQDDVPSFKDMTRKMGEYFPYRYGHAAWSFITGVWGDDIIYPLLKKTAQWGYEKAIKMTLHMDADSVSNAWEKTLKTKYNALKDSSFKDSVIGEKLFYTDNSGEINISPSISPNGKYLSFMSDKNVITLNYFIANTETKEIIGQLSTSLKKSYIDEYKYLGSNGTWSPDNEKYALTSFIKGQSKLLIVDVDKDKIINNIKIPGVESFNNPTWSPDGKNIVFSGLVNGTSDLYLYNLENETLKNLTSDEYSDMQPEWSSDGKKIIFASDRSTLKETKKYNPPGYRICIFDVTTDTINVLDFFPGANNVDPQFSPDNKSVIFLSNADGFRNLYEYCLDSAKMYCLTDYFTGISGITELSPAISVARDTGLVVYTLFKDDQYTLYKAPLNSFSKREVNPQHVNFTASELPLLNIDDEEDFVTDNLDSVLNPEPYAMIEKPYQRKFRLDYIGNSGFGVGYSQFGTGVVGGVNFLFGDILKRNQIYAALQINGEIQDFAGAVYYINRERRLNWGVGVSHIPHYVFDFDQFYRDTVSDLDISPYKEIRIFIEQLSLFSQFPFSKKTRIEYGGGIERYSFRIDSITYVTDGYSGYVEETKLDAPKGYNIYNTYLAMVGDDSNFGFTSPMRGYRYRFQLSKYFGKRQYWGVLLDYRNYIFRKPIAFAVRGIHYGRYGRNENALYPYFIGSDYYSFIRGYNGSSFQNYKCIDTETPGGKFGNSENNCLKEYNLIGSKLLVFNAEIRFPFSGHRRLSVLSSKFFYTDLIVFGDAGLAWENGLPGDNKSEVKLSWEPLDDHRIPVFSTGLSLRINLLGMLVLEPYYAYPFQRFLGKGVWGLIFSAGGW